MQEAYVEKRKFEPEVQRLHGKVVIITGGTTGIGRATANLLAKKGSKVVIFGRHETELQDAMRDLEETGGEFHGLTADTSEEHHILRVFQETGERFGDADILINNAALGAGSILNTDYDRALYILRTNLLGYLSCIREAVKMMRRKGGGHIVNVGSMSAVTREVGSDIYVASKAGIQAMSESLRKKLGQENIRVSLIEPGSVGTNLATDEPDEEMQVEAESVGEMLEAEDIAYAIYYTLTQPPRSNVLELRVAPARQGI